MKIHTEFQQGSLEWLSARAGVVTASEFGNILTPKMEPRKGQMVQSYMAQKLAEKWTGGPLPGFMTLEMDFGKILETEALPFYEFSFNETVQRVALITDDAGRVGCSPDGLVGDDLGLEIKCPEAKTHVKYLMAGELPDDYAPQVHGSMFVTGRHGWKFMSYRRRFPAFVTLIERDDKVNAVIAETVAAFVEKLDAEYKRLCEMNGGPPHRAPVFSPAQQPEYVDIVP